MSDKCFWCGTPLADAGHIGLVCLNRDCTFEMDQALLWLQQGREQKERKELARLKAKYEGKSDHE